MSKKNLLKPKSGGGSTPVESVEDIPSALLECECEAEAFAHELKLVAERTPELAPVFKVLISRADLMLNRLVACRSVLLDK